MAKLKKLDIYQFELKFKFGLMCEVSFFMCIYNDNLINRGINYDG